MRKLLYHPANKKYFLYDDSGDILCDNCGQFADDFIHMRLAKGVDVIDRVFCSKKCAKTAPSFLVETGEVKKVYPTADVIEGSIIVSDRPVELEGGDINAFEVARTNKGINSDTSSARIIDNARISKDTNRNIQQIENRHFDSSGMINWANTKRKKEVKEDGFKDKL